MSNYQSRDAILMNFSQTGIAGRSTPQDDMLADIILRLMRIENLLALRSTPGQQQEDALMGGRTRGGAGG